MRIFITGASGFVGGHASERLSQQHEVLAMARSDASADKVRAVGATPVRCSLGQVTVEQLEGVDAIVHSAAFVEEYGTREQCWDANVTGTEQLLEVALAAGVKRFIHIGTEAVLFAGGDMIGMDEATPYPEKFRFLYSETKAVAEQRVLAANSPEFTALSLRPRFVWGPRDTSVLPTLKRMVEEGRWMWLDGGRHATSTTHVANLVHSIELALDKGLGGQTYFVSDDQDTTIRDFITRLAATQGIDMPQRSIPGWVARPAATLVEGVWRTFKLKGHPPSSALVAHMLSASITIRVDKARRELGYAPVVTVDQGLAELSA